MWKARFVVKGKRKKVDLADYEEGGLNRKGYRTTTMPPSGFGNRHRLMDEAMHLWVAG